MTDIIQELLNKPACLSFEAIVRRNKEVARSEMKELANKYQDLFKINSLDELSGEFNVEYHNKFVIYLSGPPIRRNLKYSDISLFSSSSDTVSYVLSSLPPLCFYFQLNGDYPSNSNFAFWFESAWLPPRQIDLLTENVSTIIASVSDGSPLQNCCKYLEADAMSYLFSLGDPSSLVINALELFDSVTDQCQFVETLVDFEEVMRDKEFDLSTHECPVCSETYKGTHCIRLRACDHVFCKECVAQCITENVESGINSGSPVCPSCPKIVHPLEIRQVVSSQVYERYETMLLNRTLSSMPNVVECPNSECRNPHVMLDDDFTEGICVKCRFHFCAKCRENIHPDTACVSGPLANISPDEARDLVERYQNAGPQGKSMLEKQHGKLNILKLINEVASAKFINTNCKPCPNCKSPIEKISGCNRVMCTSCQKNFCWICLAPITSKNPYNHFSSARCALWMG